MSRTARSLVGGVDAFVAGAAADCCGPILEYLESRLLLSAAPLASDVLGPVGSSATGQMVHPIAIVQSVSPAASGPGSALTPAQIRHAYGIDQVMFGSIIGDGAGETIAIIDAYDYPTALYDLQQFDAYFGLQDPPSFTRVSQTGGANFPSTDPAGAGNIDGTWELEEALDIQWAHAVAPAASIILVEAIDPSDTNLVRSAVNWARSQPGVVAVSMSFLEDEYSGETSLDTYFTTPSGHVGVTFLGASGDSGMPSGYPAYSPNVISVGGTSLTVSGLSYVSETAWNGSGGGISVYETQPVYQHGVVTQSATKRTSPDVSIVADPNTGVAVFDSWDYPTSPWVQMGGTSLGTPMWAGLIALADQGRKAAGLGSLDGATQALPAIYGLQAGDFNDIASGSNGYSAGSGYDLVTGRGSPIANKFVLDLVGQGSIAGMIFQDNNANGVMDGTDSPMSGVTVFLDVNNNGVVDTGSTTNVVSTNVPKTIPDNRSSGVTSTLTFTGTGTITDLNLTLSIAHTRDSDLTAYLIGPDGTQITLFTGRGGSGNNFTNTTLDDQASASITSGSAPFTGPYKPSPGTLSSFNGKTAAGTWTLKVVDGRSGTMGTIQSWSLNVTCGVNEVTTVTAADGSYAFNGLVLGTYNVREVPPTNYTQAAPAGAHVVSLLAGATGQNFANFPAYYDVNRDGKITAADIDAIFAHIGDPAGSQWKVYPDTNPIGGQDVMFEVQNILHSLPGDANLDGVVDLSDLGILAGDYGRTSGGTWAVGDFNGDGAVDLSDLGILAGHYGQSYVAPAMAQPTVTTAVAGVVGVASILDEVQPIRLLGGRAPAAGEVADSPWRSAVERLVASRHQLRPVRVLPPARGSKAGPGA